MALAQLPPMGWNTWNTFGVNISDTLIRETADIISQEPYKSAGYEYIIMDDAWAERDRNAQGEMVPDAVKFPHGMKALADYVHSKGLKLGIYSCAGVRTCAGFPGSFDHEYQDAKTFASWGIDYLKYDFCNFPVTANCVNRFLTMSMALKASGRDILFAACQWGRQNPSHWMRSIGAHTYRSDTDIRDNFVSFANIIRNQVNNLQNNAAGCQNDLDMLTVGMEGRGHAAVGVGCTDVEYETQFAFWCMAGAPLIMGADMRCIAPKYQALLTNKGLLAIDRDPLCIPPYNTLGANDNETYKADTYLLLRLLDNNRFAIGFFNLNDSPRAMDCIFSDCGIPYFPNRKVALEDAIAGEALGEFADDIRLTVAAHGCRVLVGHIVQA